MQYRDGWCGTSRCTLLWPNTDAQRIGVIPMRYMYSVACRFVCEEVETQVSEFLEPLGNVNSDSAVGNENDLPITGVRPPAVLTSRTRTQ